MRVEDFANKFLIKKKKEYLDVDLNMERKLTLGQRTHNFLISFFLTCFPGLRQKLELSFSIIYEALDSKDLASSLEPGMYKIYELEAC